MSQELPFDPMPFIKGSFPQTILGSLPNIQRGPRSHTSFVSLSDGDYLALEITTPKNWKKSDPTVLMIHGLCGSHKSPCLVRLAKKLETKNIRSIRLNLRGCGTGKGKARRFYHAGQSDDAFAALKFIVSQTPESEITLLGFSLGGNITLKLAAELSIANLKFLKKAIAINPPVDLLSSVKLLAEPHNRVYEKYFVKLLREDIDYRSQKFSNIRKIDFSDHLHFYDFDRLYTVPEYGFKDNADFYKRASSKYLIPAISFDCNILFSEDDPIIKIQDFENFQMPKNVHLYRTKKGGHIGYLSKPGKSRSIHWLDNVLLDWILES
ncbi:MAG: 2-succinyl-6-hydroxy-2,4-cyclohexadiene-1-carboxylate synthase [Candidatus Anoxychlamydiales bacterium]|nr:2-succinyl-6-hydroxy-2,4-cyclohexadiene-1-carboxylate synthase [Candidatus Anoxychlamydiales bacterium]NGX36472.1 2-succinyl-6-hydroxy-2,4-cyclohexadiene-1-carboxylate synthase [Candidatus Anoxychlamydiales bacterium]